MKFRIHVWIWVCCMLLSVVGHAQNTSNKGTDFWTGYMAHIDGTSSNMSLYITSDISTSGTVSIPGKGWSTNYNVTANNITVVTIPQSLAYMWCSDCILNQGIHITSKEPVVVFAHIYANSRSDATLVLPTETAGRDYYAMSFTQKVTGSGRQNEFMIVGLEDSTWVDITPAAGTTSGTHTKGVTYSKLLMQGQVYQIQSDSDLTTSRIVSYGTGNNGCKRIAVFSGSSFNPLGCSTASTGDNLFQQMYPVSAWGKNYITAPMKTRIGGDYFRALAGTNNTKITINGWKTQTLQAGQYYEWITDSPQYIISNYGICLAQFQRTQGCDNMTGDPSMVILNSTEQQLNDITLYSSPYQNITGNYINIYMESKDTAGFWLDNIKPTWKTVPSNPNWAYAQQTVASGNHHLYADSFFNAIAYGFGNVESYSYSAGANIKNQNQEIQLKYGASTATCKGQPVYFKGVCTYVPYSWTWYFGDGSSDTIQNPVHTYADTGYYTVSLVTLKSNGNDCDSKDSTVYKVHIYKLPSPVIRYGAACSNEQVSFYDSTNVAPYTISSVKWDFGDGATSTGKNPKHQFSTFGTYKIKLTVNSTGNCAATDSINLNVNASPKVKYIFADSCIRDGIMLYDSSTLMGSFKNSYSCSDILLNWGDGKTDTASNYIGNKSFTHAYSKGADYTLMLKVSDCITGCKDSFTQILHLEDRTIPGFSYTNGCEKDSIVITDTSKISYGTILSRYYDFGDGKNATYSGNPGSFKKLYSAYGNYNISLISTNANGCKDTLTQSLSINPKPRPGFTATTVCKGDSTTFKDTGTIPMGSLAQAHWYFGDGTDTLVNSGITLRKLYTNAGTYSVKLILFSNLGCKDSITQNITVQAKPKAQFSLMAGCQFDSVLLKDLSTGSNINSRIWYLPKDTLLNPGTNFKYIFTDTGLQSIKLKVITSAGCADSITGNQQVYPKPNAAFSISDICYGDSTLLKDGSAISGGSIKKWRVFWGNGDSTIYNSSPGTFRKKYKSTGNYQICLITESNQTCRDTVCSNQQVYKLPQANLSVSGHCMNDSVHFTTGFTKGDTGLYYYKFFNGKNVTDSSNILKSYHFIYGQKGSFLAYLMVKDSLGCKDSVSFLLKTDTVPVPQFNFTPQCAGDSVQFTDSSYIKSGSIFQLTANWGDSISANPKIGGISSHYYKTGGFKSITWKATSLLGCSDTITKIVYILPKPVVAFTIPNICFKDSVYFADLTTIDSGSITGRLFRFGDGDSTFYSGANSYAHKYANPGQYPISLVATSDKGCKDSVSYTYTVNASPIAQIGIVAPCINATTILIDSSTIATGAVFRWKWTLSDGSIDTNQQFKHQFADTGTYQVKLYVASGNLCKDSTISSIYIYQKPKAAFNVNPVCEYDSIKILPASTDPKGSIKSTLWKFNATDSLMASGNQSVKYLYTTPGKQTIIQIAESNFGCYDTSTKKVDIYPKPITLSSFQNVCAYDSLLLPYQVNVGTDVFKRTTVYWGNGDSSRSTLDSGRFSHLYQSSGTYFFTMVSENIHQCVDTIIRKVEIHPVPIAKIYTTDTAQCFNGNQFSLNDSSRINAGFYSRRWSYLSDSAAQILVSYPVEGTYAVTLLTVSDSGCIDSMVQHLYVWASPHAKIQLSKDTVCFKGNQFQIIDSSRINSGSLKRYIYWGDGSTDTSRIAAHSYSSAGADTISLISVSDKQCTDTAFKTVKIWPSPLARFFTNGNCPGDTSIFIDSSGIIGSSIKQARWHWGDGDSAIGFSAPMDQKHLYPAPGTYLVNYSVTSVEGCTDQYIDSIKIYKLPTPALKIKNVCSYDSLLVNDLSNTPGSQFKQAIISWGDGAIDSFFSQNSYKHLYTTPGSRLVHYYIQSQQGCIDSATSAITIYEVPRAGFTRQHQCEQENILFNDTSRIDSGYIVKRIWDWGDLINETVNGKDTSHLYLTYGLYPVRLVVMSNHFCTDSAFDSLQIHQLPVAIIQTRDTCQNDSLILTDIGYSYGDPVRTRFWDIGNGSITEDSSGKTTIKNKYPKHGLYHIHLITITTAGCSDTTQGNVYIKPSPVLKLQAPEICYGDSASMMIQASIDSGKVNQYDIQWGDGNSDSHFAITDTVKHWYSHDSDYFTNVLVTSDLGCQTQSKTSLIVHPLPVAAYSTNKRMGCEPFAVQFYDISKVKRDQIISRAWDFGDGQIDSVKYPINIYLHRGLYQPHLSVTTDAGCTSSFEDSIPIIVHEKPVAGFEPTYKVSTTLSPEVHFVNTSLSAEKWIWNLGDGYTTNEKNPTHIYMDTGVYSVMQIAINHYGCKDTLVKFYEVIPSYTLFLTNSFTPNGDDLNETWGPDGMPAGFRAYKLSIYNRWGELIFESDKPEYRWNGTFRNEGAASPSEVYIYRIDFTDYTYKKHNYQGTILLLR